MLQYCDLNKESVLKKEEEKLASRHRQHHAWFRLMARLTKPQSQNSGSMLVPRSTVCPDSWVQVD